MSIEILDGTTILNFVNDDEAFSAAVRRRFAELDGDGDGVLSYAEMERELKCLRVLDLTDEIGDDAEENAGELYQSLFAQFDRDSDGVVGPDEYAAETREMMLAIAAGMGPFPVKMLLGEGSFFKMAVELEAVNAARVD